MFPVMLPINLLM